VYEALIGHLNAQLAPAAGCKDALTSQARIDAGVTGAVNKVFFPVGYLWDKVVAFFQINVAGAAGAHHAAVVMELYAIVEGYFQYAIASTCALDGARLEAFLFEGKMQVVHRACESTPPC
jgi:hypothetical protein